MFDNRRAIEQAKHAAQVRNSPLPTGQAKLRHIDPTTTEVEYSRDDIEFANAMQAYKQRTGRVFPTCHEILDIIRDLGWQKVGVSA